MFHLLIHRNLIQTARIHLAAPVGMLHGGYVLVA